MRRTTRIITSENIKKIAKSISKANYCTFAVTMTAKAVDFEVFGRVQGVYFRKHTKEYADKLGIRGWCMNTSKGTVVGQVEGPADKVADMMNFLKTKGSPSSVIEKVDFTNMKEIDKLQFLEFEIRQEK